MFEPRTAQESVEGWTLHATRRRDIHEHEARRLDGCRYTRGTAATCLAAVAGTSAFAAWQSTSKSTVAAVITAAVGVGAAVLASVVTFLDLGARAEADGRAAIAYKGVLRDVETPLGTAGKAAPSSTDDVLTRLLPLLTEADRIAPTVPRRLARKVESQPFCFVSSAEELASNPTKAHHVHNPNSPTPSHTLDERPSSSRPPR